MLENFRLRVFRSVAENLSFRKAGESLYLTQPAVTLQVKALEEELGTRLFLRSASGVRLTEAGSVLLKYAEQLRELANQAEDHLGRLQGEVTGELALGASTTIAQYVLPVLLAEFMCSYPATRLHVSSENTERVCEGVASGRFGLGLIEGPPLRRDLKVERWFDDELLIVVPATHEWAGQAEITPEKLLGVPLVMRERGSGSRHVVENGLQRAGLRLGSLRIVMELDSTEAILSCIAAGLGIGFVSNWSIALRGAGAFSTLRLAGTSILRSFSFVFLQGPQLQHAAAAMVQFLKSRLPIVSSATLPDRPGDK